MIVPKLVPKPTTAEPKAILEGERANERALRACVPTETPKPVRIQRAIEEAISVFELVDR